MQKSLALLLIGGFLLVQFTHAFPSDSNSSEEKPDGNKSSEESDESDEVKNATPRQKLYHFIVKEFSSLAVNDTQGAKTVFAETLKDESLAKLDNPALKTKLEPLQNFLAKIDAAQVKKGFERNATVFNLTLELFDLIQKYNTSKIQNPNTEDVLIELALNRNGLEKLRAEARVAYENIITTNSGLFVTEIEQFLATLNEKEKADRKEFIAWFNEFKAEQDPKLKVDKFTQFFTFVKQYQQQQKA